MGSLLNDRDDVGLAEAIKRDVHLIPYVGLVPAPGEFGVRHVVPLTG